MQIKRQNRIILHKNAQIRFTDQYNSEKRLWQAVLLQAIIDAKTNSGRIRNKRVKYKAIDWLTNNNEDFLNVCEMAGLITPYQLKNGMKKVLEGRLTS